MKTILINFNLTNQKPPLERDGFGAVGRGIEPHARESIRWVSAIVPGHREIPTTYHDYYFNIKNNNPKNFGIVIY